MNESEGEVKMLELDHFYNIDNMDGMKEFPDKYFNLAIVDPPYGLNISNNMGRRKGDKKSEYKRIHWDKTPPKKEYFAELFRVSKNQIIWGANHFISLIPYDSSCWIIWDKLFSPEVSFAAVEMAWTSFDKPAKKFICHPDKQCRIHPTQKPVALYEWILKNYASPGDKILDTHVGSASSLIACHNMGMQYIGFEIDAEYYRKANERLQAVLSQQRLY